MEGINITIKQNQINNEINPIGLYDLLNNIGKIVKNISGNKTNCVNLKLNPKLKTRKTSNETVSIEIYMRILIML